MSAPRAVGLLGGGVIGGGWAARFLLAGVDVRLYDPDPEAERKLGEMLENARRALALLSAVPLAARGLAEPASRRRPRRRRGVELVQESAPERLELKQALLAEACAAADPDVLIASSTSGPAADGAGRRDGAARSASSSRIRSTRCTCCRSSSCARGERTARPAGADTRG